jgi:hypothetical protein
VVPGWSNRGTNSRATSVKSLCRILDEACWCSIAVQTATKPLLNHGIEFTGWQMSVSGFKVTSTLLRGRKSAKTLTSLLMLPSVLANRSFIVTLKLGRARNKKACDENLYK